MDLNTAILRVRELLRRDFPTLRALDLQADTALLSAGHLDSFDVIAVLAAIEKAFGIELDVDHLPFERFESPRTIATLCVEGLWGREQAS